MADLFDKKSYPAHWQAIDEVFRAVQDDPHNKGNHLAQFKPVVEITRETAYLHIEPGKNTLYINPDFLDPNRVPLDQFKAAVGHEWQHHINRNTPSLYDLFFPDRNKLRADECYADQFSAHYTDKEALIRLLQSPPQTMHTGNRGNWWTPRGVHPRDQQRIDMLKIPGIEKVPPHGITLSETCGVVDVQPQYRHLIQLPDAKGRGRE